MLLPPLALARRQIGQEKSYAILFRIVESGQRGLKLANGETNESDNTKESALKKEYKEEQPPEVNEQPLVRDALNEQPLVRDALNEQPLMTEDLMMMSCGTELAFVHNDLCTAKVLANRIFVAITAQVR